MRTKGIVRWFSDTKGFGFITPQGSGRDCFVHHSSIRAQGFRPLVEGTRVMFDVVEGARGPAAHDVVATDDIVAA